MTVSNWLGIYMKMLRITMSKVQMNVSRARQEADKDPIKLERISDFTRLFIEITFFNRQAS